MHRFSQEFPFEPTASSPNSGSNSGLGYVLGHYRGAVVAIRAQPVLPCPDAAVSLQYRGVLYLADHYLADRYV